MKNKVRIIGGEWRSRLLHFNDVPGLRPTPSRVRETLFNWLQNDVKGSRCLDLFAGSGALGFEAASRGANSVALIENNPLVTQSLTQNAVALNAKQVEIIQKEALHYLSEEPYPTDIVFIDPPFGKGMVQEACRYLDENKWLVANALIYIESESHLKLENMPKSWRNVKSKIAGDVGYHLFQRIN